MPNNHNITAVILAGGFGSRLQSVVSDRPKVIADVAGRPFLVYLLDQLAAADIRKVVLCTGYMAEVVRDCFGDNYGALQLFYSKEDEPLGTGGALRLALPQFCSEVILVMNGDSYIDTDLDAYIDWFFEKERQAAMLLTKVDNTCRYGTVKIGKNETITAFKEKNDNVQQGWINAGIYLLKRLLVGSIPTGKFYSLEHDFFPSLAGGKLYGYCDEGRFIDIGTPQAYARAEGFFAVKNHKGSGEKQKDGLLSGKER